MNKTWTDKEKKNNVVYTPIELSNYIFNIVKFKGFKTVLDPSLGEGDLMIPWKKNHCHILGSDVEDKNVSICDEFILSDIDNNDFEFNRRPDIVVMNPPFNGASGRRLFPEVFLKKVFDKYGYDIPVIMITGDNFLNNSRLNSKRRAYIKDNKIEITSIITLPLDVFEDVLFNTQVLFFNIKGIKPHYMY